jgi:hypothetical protein
MDSAEQHSLARLSASITRLLGGHKTWTFSAVDNSEETLNVIHRFANPQDFSCVAFN